MIEIYAGLAIIIDDSCHLLIDFGYMLRAFGRQLVKPTLKTHENKVIFPIGIKILAHDIPPHSKGQGPWPGSGQAKQACSLALALGRWPQDESKSASDNIKYLMTHR